MQSLPLTGRARGATGGFWIRSGEGFDAPAGRSGSLSTECRAHVFQSSQVGLTTHGTSSVEGQGNRSSHVCRQHEHFHMDLLAL